MGLDGFTIFAQIVNFLVLVYLLKRFLYRPVIDAMDQREAKIAARLQQAEDQARQAADETAAYQQKSRELEQRREQLLTHAQAEAEAERKARLEAARQEIERSRQAWKRDLEHEQQHFLQEMRRRLSQSLCAVSRRAVADLANSELEAQVIAVFLERLSQLSAEQKQALAESCAEPDEGVAIISAFGIPERQRQTLRSAVQRLLGRATAVQFREQPDLVCGIVMETPARRVEWSIAGYFDELEDRLTSSLGANQLEVA